MLVSDMRPVSPDVAALTKTLRGLIGRTHQLTSDIDETVLHLVSYQTDTQSHADAWRERRLAAPATGLYEMERRKYG